MSYNKISRNAYFLGTKIRNLRKSNRLTMEELSVRCMKVHTINAPSVSYLSMIERGKRIPSIETLEVIAEVFQKPLDWFLDNYEKEDVVVVDNKKSRGGLDGISLEPSFLFSQENLQITIPELLSQAAISGREFAHLLIRVHQEKLQNQFPDIERAADQISAKRMPLEVHELMDICKKLNLKIKWFDESPTTAKDAMGHEFTRFRRSYIEYPNRVFLNKRLRQQPQRLKYDLALSIGYAVLHGDESIKSEELDILGHDTSNTNPKSATDAYEILQAWQDFERSFFAGALLCPKVPFRRILDEYSYDILKIAEKVGITSSVVMRRMTVVSNYPDWHYFDAYAPGKLKAVYRGNGIPLPWGNMRMVEDPCEHWAVFRMLRQSNREDSTQISVMDTRHGPKIYACQSIHAIDIAGDSHVQCAGIEMNAVMQAQNIDAMAIANDIKRACENNGGTAPIPAKAKQQLLTHAKILNIGWIEKGLEKPARLICGRSNNCPRNPDCTGKNRCQKRA